MVSQHYNTNLKGWLSFSPLTKALPRTCGLVPPKQIISCPSNWLDLALDRVKVQDLYNAYQVSAVEYRVLMKFIRWFAIRHLDVRKRYTEQSLETLEFYKREVLLWKPLGRFLLQYDESWILEVTTRRLFIRRHELIRLRQRLVFNVSRVQLYKHNENPMAHAAPTTDVNPCVASVPPTTDVSPCVASVPPSSECPQSCAEGTSVRQGDIIVNSMQNVHFDNISSPFSSQATVTSHRMRNNVPDSSTQNPARAPSRSLSSFLGSLTPNMGHLLSHFRTAGIDDEAFADILTWNPYLRASFLRRELKTRCSGYQLQVIVTGMDRCGED
ncbi:hypothetical protein SERLA73DRAFT_190590 [Serpula lacrymans var. lacrymans S7.3]|uniref:Uncharacterized protein n=2 Tax=Serpula lacrymans var. lacrymans TaxID=341189 RepID=F8QG00_SERL3|nr:uncharacterized protein SERLADRAFT_463453 [Serpula lacrymans var. lacrymans S7.9]EGN92748.1 hypothetical protein SERLA73DRAFT_190590 [Serpula lacrymans var. lacrymans S7.3]EGO26408.1 hypothetical protein SERLADRAFT_463453 [Serpula lacrymans var. lacrymans S7.9]